MSQRELEESGLVLSPIPMGDRLYLPTAGIFTQVDPIEGGTPNNYVYPPDPVNKFDLDGNWSWPRFRVYTMSNKRTRDMGMRCLNSFTCSLLTSFIPGGFLTKVKWGERIKNGNNLIRIGRAYPGAAFRVSIGAAPKYYETMPTWKKILFPVHIHIERNKAGIDFNWVKKAYYRSW